METVVEPERRLPIISTVDVCVVGGGMAGVFAAVRASQLGMKVAIIEKNDFFGGIATAGNVNAWFSMYDTTGKKKIVSGLTEEVLEELKARGAAQYQQSAGFTTVNTEELKLVLDNLIKKNKIEAHLGTRFCTAFVGDSAASSAVVEFAGVNTGVSCAVVENADGRGVIKAKFFVDASGDAALCRRVLLSYYKVANMQPPTICGVFAGIDGKNAEIAKIVAEHGEEFGMKPVWRGDNAVPGFAKLTVHNEGHVMGYDVSFAAQHTAAELDGREMIDNYLKILRKYLKGGDKVQLVSLPASIGVRETFHVKSLHRVKDREILGGTKFKDAIANGSYPVDVHNPDGSVTIKRLDGTTGTIGTDGVYTEGRWKDEDKNAPTYYQIPFRCLVPDHKICNILSVGRCIDAEEEAFSAMRVMVNANQVGEAAGVAAAIAVKGGYIARDIPVAEVRERLAGLGAIIL